MRTATMWASVMTAIALAGAAAPAGARPPVPTVADPIRGLDLWRGATVGMTVVEVERLFPAATAPSRPATLTGGEIDRLQLGAVDLEGYPATAHFFFRDAGLVSVELTLEGLAAGASSHNVAIATRIAQAFASRYGAGYDCGDRSLGDVTAYECKWLRTPLSIRLWYMDTAGQAPLFYLAYRQADDPGYDL